MSAGHGFSGTVYPDLYLTPVFPNTPIEDFMDSVSYRGASFSPDSSKLLVSHNRSGIFNVYAIN
ncbi:MAG: hypothetical protein MRY76_05360 [Pseudomonadales bacterium]|nr:hypothetical protein [Pseudomonadales bacterium]